MRKEPYRTYALIATVYLLVWFFFPAAVFADYSIDTNSDMTGLMNFGDNATGGQEKLAQLFTTAGEGEIDEIQICLRENGTVADNLVMGLYTDNAGSPDTLVEDVTIVGDIGGSYARHTFTFATPVAVAATTNYWVVIGRSGGMDGSHNYAVCGEGTGSDFMYMRSSAWNSFGGEMNMAVSVLEAGGGGSATSTSATSTPVDDPNRDIFNGILLFMVSFFGTVWLFRRPRT